MDEDTKQYYKLIAKSARFAKNLRRAEEAINEAVATCKNPAVSWSYGKDSLVVVDIARRIKSDILVININRGFGGDLKEVVAQSEAWAAKCKLNYHRVPTPRSLFEVYEEAGGIEEVPRGMVKKNLLAGFQRARDQFDIDCTITGLRAAENRRRAYLRKYGTFHYSKTEEIYKCKPVLHWPGEQIWAYIVSQNLPYPAWYDRMARFVGYERARYTNWAGLVQSQYGRIVMLRRYYPDEYKVFVRMHPEIAHYA